MEFIKLPRATKDDLAGRIWPPGLEFDTRALKYDLSKILHILSMMIFTKQTIIDVLVKVGTAEYQQYD